MGGKQQLKRKKRRRQNRTTKEKESKGLDSGLGELWGDDKEIGRLENPAARTILSFVLPQWPKLLAENSLKPVAVYGEGADVGLSKHVNEPATKCSNTFIKAKEARRMDSLDSASGEVASSCRSADPIWTYYETLSVEEQMEALTITDLAKVRLVKCVVRALRIAHIGLQEGLFLAVQSPGRDALSFAAGVHAWDSLRCASAMFERPTQTELEAGQKLLDCSLVLDSEEEGPRSVLALRPAFVVDARRILENALGSAVGRGRLVQTELRTGDQDDLQSMQDPSKGNTRAYEKVASTLFSGSVPSLLATLLCRNVSAYVSRHSRSGGDCKLSPLASLRITTLSYLGDTLGSMRNKQVSKNIGSEETCNNLSQLAQKPRQEALLLLFTCPVSQWGSRADAVMRACAAALQDFHADQVANDLVMGQELELEQQQQLKQSSQAAFQTASVDVEDKHLRSGESNSKREERSVKAQNDSPVQNVVLDTSNDTLENVKSSSSTTPSDLQGRHLGKHVVHVDHIGSSIQSENVVGAQDDSECLHKGEKDSGYTNREEDHLLEVSSTSDSVVSTEAIANQGSGPQNSFDDDDNDDDDDDEEEEAEETTQEDGNGNKEHEIKQIRIKGSAGSDDNEVKPRPLGPDQPQEALLRTIVHSRSASYSPRESESNTEGEWKKVEPASRRARRHSHRQLSKRRSESPCQQPGSKPQSSGPILKTASKDVLMHSNVAPNNLSSSATGMTSRRRGESSETLSLSSVNSSSTLYEEQNTPPIYPNSKLTQTFRSDVAMRVDANAKLNTKPMAGTQDSGNSSKGGRDSVVTESDNEGISKSTSSALASGSVLALSIEPTSNCLKASTGSPAQAAIPTMLSPLRNTSTGAKSSPAMLFSATNASIHAVANPMLGASPLAYSNIGPPLVINGIHAGVLDMLTQDLEEMSHGLEQIAVTRRPWQLAVAERIRASVESLFPGASARLFGSLETGLAAPCSDVDMVVQGFNVPTRVAMRTLLDHLRGQSWVQMIQGVENTAVPVIKLATAQIPISFGNQGSLINIDITFDGLTHTGLRTCALVRRLMANYPPLKPLTLVLKQFLVEKGLNDPFVGGLSSYGLVLMITAILQRFFPSGMSGIPYPSNTLGAVFWTFLTDYADPSFIDRGVWVHMDAAATPEVFTMLRMKSQHLVEIAKSTAPAPLYILDPTSDVNSVMNVGRTCFGIHQVIQVFAGALEAIQIHAPRAEVGLATPDWSVLGAVFSTGHHRHVVNLVVQVWCPRENPVTERKMNLRQWAASAKTALESVDHKGMPCPWCQHKPHAPTCTLKLLLASFPHQEMSFAPSS